VETVAVPLQLAVPLLTVAAVGGVVYPLPGFTITILAGEATLFGLVRFTVAVPPLPPPFVKVSVQFCPAFPVALIVPLVY